jgi:hypothetical protein
MSKPDVQIGPDLHSSESVQIVPQADEFIAKASKIFGSKRYKFRKVHDNVEVYPSGDATILGTMVRDLLDLATDTGMLFYIDFYKMAIVFYPRL